MELRCNGQVKVLMHALGMARLTFAPNKLPCFTQATSSSSSSSIPNRPMAGGGGKMARSVFQGSGIGDFFFFFLGFVFFLLSSVSYHLTLDPETKTTGLAH